MHCKRSCQPQLLGSHTCPTPSKHYLWNDGVIRPPPPHTASRGATRGLITVKMPALSLHVEPAASPHKNRGQHWSQPHTWSYQIQCVEPLNPTIATHNQCMCQWDPTTFIYMYNDSRDASPHSHYKSSQQPCTTSGSRWSYPDPSLPAGELPAAT